MKPALAVGLFWLFFGGSDMGLATRPARALLMRRWGEWGFMLVFLLAAGVSFTLLAGLA